MESWIIALISSVVSGMVTVVGAVYWFGRNTATVSDMHSLRDLAIEHRDEIKEEIASERRIFGEAIAALRQKINDVELDGAKYFVRRDSWHQAMNQLQAQLGAADKAAEERLLRLETKLDGIAEKLLSYRPITT